MVTGASTADLAVILIDARKGVLTQTRRHSYLASLLGIRHVVLAVNKMDLVGLRQEVFDAIVARLPRLRRQIGLKDIVAIPMSGADGDNVTARSDAHALVHGPTLLDHLETVRSTTSRRGRPFRMPVQWVNRPNSTSAASAGHDRRGRGRAGRQSACCRRAGHARSTRIVTIDGDLDEAVAGQSVTLTLARRDRLLARRRDRRRRRPARGRRPVRGDHRLDGRRADCCPAAPIC